MNFSKFSSYLNQVESTASRLEMTAILAELFRETNVNEIDKAIYLSLGRLGPLYTNIEFGVSTKLMTKVIAEAFRVDQSEVEDEYKKIGDLGDVAVVLNKKSGFGRGDKHELTVTAVFDQLTVVAVASGKGSQEQKTQQLAELLRSLDPLSVKYVVRIPLGKLRLGFSDMTILDALSQMLVGDKTVRNEIEQKYNISADIGKIAQLIKRGGVEQLRDISITIGVPIRPAAADRLPGAKEIVEKLGDSVAEPKLDGFRLQVHYQAGANGMGSVVRLFSRNLEDMSEMFPEITNAVRQLKVESVIFEGEAIGYHPSSGEFLPFQETMQRRRKYDIAEKTAEIPLKLFGFDVLYLNGEPCLDQPLAKRRINLVTVLSGDKTGVISPIEQVSVCCQEELSRYFLKQIEQGLEGIVVKRPDAHYAAGKRNQNWVKLKRDEHGELNDTIDCVVMGYKMGLGKRSGFGIGAFLVGIYDEESDSFETISNVGTGLTDDQWREMRSRCDEIQVSQKPARYDVPKELEQDVWVSPEMVVEVLADEITRSPLHTAGKLGDEPGYALRFPRLVKWRDDKKSEQATSVDEIVLLFGNQKIE